MTQNIYDNEAFFAGYDRLDRSVHGLDGAPEWPALKALLPNMQGLKVLDLGCGFGWFCRWARENGATRVTGVDASEKMLARGRATTPDPAIGYSRADLERIDLPGAAFDVVYSSLTFHYIETLDRLMAQIHGSLVPGGRLVFSVEHPIFMAPSRPAWARDAEGRDIWPVDRYLDEGRRSTDWLAKGVIKQHRTIGTYANLLIGAGFTIAHVEEWGPTEEQIAIRPEWAMVKPAPALPADGGPALTTGLADRQRARHRYSTAALQRTQGAGSGAEESRKLHRKPCGNRRRGTGTGTGRGRRIPLTSFAPRKRRRCPRVCGARHRRPEGRRLRRMGGTSPPTATSLG